MKLIKTIGLILFISGFTLFNFLLFWGSYKLTPEHVNKLITDRKKNALFAKQAAPLFGENFSSQFTFVSKLGEIFHFVNNKQIELYSFTETEIDRLVSLNRDKFLISTVDSVFDNSNDISAFKNKAFNEYGSWLDGRAFTNKEELKSQLKDVSDRIEKYGIVNQFGFDRYQIKDLTYSLTKAAAVGPAKDNPVLLLFLTIGLCIAGATLYILPKLDLQSGIQNNGIFFNVMKNVGWLGVLTGTWLIIFYVVLYFYPEYMTNWIIMVDPVSRLINGNEASRFFLYGFMYTLCIFVMGVRMIILYRHSKYHVLRTCSVMFFQTAFAFLIPEILIRLNKPYFDFKNIWPLDYSFFFDSRLSQLVEQRDFRNLYDRLGYCVDHHRRPGSCLLFWKTLVLLMGMWLRWTCRNPG